MFRGLVIWLAIMAVETVHGVLRGLFLVPRVGETVASGVGWPIGMLIVLVLTFALINWTGLRDKASLLRLGVLWAVLTFVFETAIGVLRGLDGPRIWAEINPLSGGLMLYSLVIMLLAPIAMASLRQRRG